MLARFLLELGSNGHSQGTVREYGYTISRWERSGLSPVEYLASMRVKQSTRMMRARVLKSYLGWASSRNGHTNPLGDIHFRQPEPEPVRPFSPSEIDAMMGVADPLDRAIVVCLLKLGLRASELVSVRLEDLNDDTLRVKGKGQKTRVLAVTGLLDPLKVVIESHLDYQNLYRRVKTLGRRAHIPQVHPHTFRHTWASSCKASGMNDSDLMILGGWSNLNMLRRYTAFFEGERALEAHRRFLECA